MATVFLHLRACSEPPHSLFLTITVDCKGGRLGELRAPFAHLLDTTTRWWQTNSPNSMNICRSAEYVDKTPFDQSHLSRVCFHLHSYVSCETNQLSNSSLNSINVSKVANLIEQRTEEEVLAYISAGYTESSAPLVVTLQRWFITNGVTDWPSRQDVLLPSLRT